MSYRIERDSLGDIKVEQNKYWGAQTERSRRNFPIGHEKMPKEIIHAFAILKRATATANCKLGLLDQDKEQAIHHATNLIMQGVLDEHFPLVVWQTGSGTQSNMNVNEVIAHVGNDWLEAQRKQERLHPNDDVNKSQSSNDTYPTAMYVACSLKLKREVLPAIQRLTKTLQEKSEAFASIVKIGRTHYQDATRITLGQEISGWVAMLEQASTMIQESRNHLQALAIGGTAVGTGLNTEPGFADYVCEEITALTNDTFISAQNKFQALTSYDEIVYAHGGLK